METTAQKHLPVAK